jgi:rhodanese-related sulfurtransferase
VSVALLGVIGVAPTMMAVAASPAGGGGTKVAVPGGAYTNIGPTELRERLAHKDFVFVNVHVPYEGEIAQTDANIPYDQISQHTDRLPADRDAMVVLYCRTGHMSVTASETLVRLGYTNVWNLEGGFTAWARAGFPFRKP